MAENNNPNQPAGGSGRVPMTVPLAQGATLDLSFLPEEKRQALLEQYSKRALDISAKAAEMGVEVGVLGKTLDALTSSAKDASDAGNSFTGRGEYRNSTGRTEVVIGNTPEAARGKTGFGVDNKTILIVGAILVVIVVLALVFGR